MRRTAVVLLAIGLVLVACGSGKSRTFHRYYDPLALFSIDLPVDNSEQVTPAQTGASDQPSILSGVVSAPPQPTQEDNQIFGGQLLNQQAPADQTIYEMFVVSTDTFSNLQDMVLYFLTADPAVDVREDRSLSMAGMSGQLIVADVLEGEQATNSLAAAFTLGQDGRGYLIAALCPAEEWRSEQSDFLKVVKSFRFEVHPGIQSIPLAGQTA